MIERENAEHCNRELSMPEETTVRYITDALRRPAPARAPAETPSAWLDVVVTRRDAVAAGIVALELAREDGAALPAVEAGAHIDVEARSGLVRPHSLTGDPAERGR